MAVVAIVSIVVVFFHPDEAACFAICFVVDVIVGMVGHIMTNAMLITVFITVFITMVTMVVVSVTAKHLESSHCEMFRAFPVELNNVFSLFEMED